jgi:integrase
MVASRYCRKLGENFWPHAGAFLHLPLERSARLRLAIRNKPYHGPSLLRGAALQYRRCKSNGTWVLKASDGHAKYWTRRIAQADDFEESDGRLILKYFEAVDAAKKLLARGGGAEGDAGAPLTLGQALAAYRADLLSRGARAYNAQHALVHLSSTLLSKPIRLLVSRELQQWRDGLVGTLAPATVTRICKSICAALELARKFDPQGIRNNDAWKIGLAALPDSQRARNVVLPDATVHALVAAAYERDAALSLLVDVLAVTGCRPSQAARLLVADLRADHPPKLMMPKSGKGGGRNRASKKHERYSVPITVALAKHLKAAAARRAPDEALLLRGGGEPWGSEPSAHYRAPVREVVAAIGENPDRVTVYALRHSNITRMLLRNVPVRLIASLHNTSIIQIERNYSRHITEHSDDVSRAALLPESEPAPAAGNVIPLAR